LELPIKWAITAQDFYKLNLVSTENITQNIALLRWLLVEAGIS